MQYRRNKDSCSGEEKHVAIVTIIDEANYGNRLQNYALQTALRKLGCEVDTLRFSPASAAQQVKGALVRGVYAAIFALPHGIGARLSGSRWKKVCLSRRVRSNIACFSGEIRFRPVKDAELKEHALDSSYDCFVAGSDQIWNTDFWRAAQRERKEEQFFLRFAKPEKRISYAASIGRSSIAPEYEESFRSTLTQFRAISVREEQAKQMVDGLLARDAAQVVLDPTMLLSAEEWRALLTGHRKSAPEEKYVFCFFLGSVSKKRRAEIAELCKNRGLAACYMNDTGEKAGFACDALDFVNRIFNAELVVTDSFHAAVFSILFERPFAVLNRESKEYASMNSRMDTLLGMTGLKERFDPRLTEELFSCDYGKARELLDIRRKSSMDWLQDKIGCLSQN